MAALTTPSPIAPLLYSDAYKVDHRRQYPPGTTRVYSNFTNRASRIDGVNHVVHFGLQAFLQQYCVEAFAPFFAAFRSFEAWMVAYEIVADAPKACKAERLARGESVASASRQMIGVSPYTLRNFESGRDVSASDLRSILLWMAAGGRNTGSSVQEPEPMEESKDA